jgi:hypothetical protein
VFNQKKKDKLDACHMYVPGVDKMEKKSVENDGVYRYSLFDISLSK